MELFNKVKIRAAKYLCSEIKIFNSTSQNLRKRTSLLLYKYHNDLTQDSITEACTVYNITFIGSQRLCCVRVSLCREVRHFIHFACQQRNVTCALQTEYKQNYLPVQSRKSASFHPLPEQAADPAGRESTKTGKKSTKTGTASTGSL